MPEMAGKFSPEQSIYASKHMQDDNIHDFPAVFITVFCGIAIESTPGMPESG